MKNNKSYMSWNEPEKNKKDSPPDIDEIIYKIKSNILGFLGKRNNNKNPKNGLFPAKIIRIILLLLFLNVSINILHLNKLSFWRIDHRTIGETIT